MKTNIFFAVILALTIGALGISLDDMSETDTEADARKDVQQQLKFERAAQAMCGPQAAFADLGNGVVQCLQHNGKRAAKVAIK